MTESTPRASVVAFYPGDCTGATMAHAAGAGRLAHLAQVARAAGSDVVVVGMHADAQTETTLPGGLRAILVDSRPTATGLKARLPHFLTQGEAVAARVEDIVDQVEATTLLVYGTSLRLGPALVAMGRRRGLHLLCSVNEWGHRSAQSLPSYALLRAGIHHAARSYDGIIGISSMMETWLRAHSRAQVETIPSIFDLTRFPEPQPAARPHGRIVLAYAGAVHGGKDATNNALRGLAMLDEAERARFEFHLFGSTREDIVASLGDDADSVLTALSDAVTFRGFMPLDELRPALAGADFTVLLRPCEPYANAGFPTKFAESLVLGVPVIANATSDIAHYLRDGENGFLVPDHTPEACAITLRRVLLAADEDPSALRRAARQTGCDAFDLTSYADVWRRLEARA